MLMDGIRLFLCILGKTLNAFGGSSIKINPDIEEAFKLRGWFDKEAGSTNFQAHTSEYKANSTPRMTFDEVKNASANIDPAQTLYFETKGTIVMMSKSENTFQYPACPTTGCNKKVMEENGSWRCENCNKTVSEPDYRYIMGVNVSDHSGQEWIQAFNDSGMVITGRPAKDLVEVSFLLILLFKPLPHGERESVSKVSKVCHCTHGLY